MSEEKTLEKLDLNKLQSENGKLTIEHIHEEKETEKIYYEKDVNLQGTIQAPGNFVEKRINDVVKQHDVQRCNVAYSYDPSKLYIILTTSENYDPQYVITGKLMKNPEIVVMKINTKEKMTIESMVEHIKFNRFFFSNKDQHLSLVSNLMKFKVEAKKVIEAQNDQRGNIKDVYEIKNESNMDLGFDVIMPVYKGQPAKKFRVDICYNVRERSLEVWLESAELEEILKSDARMIIDNELGRMPKEFVFIEQ